MTLTRYSFVARYRHGAVLQAVNITAESPRHALHQIGDLFKRHAHQIAGLQIEVDGEREVLTISVEGAPDVAH